MWSPTVPDCGDRPIDPLNTPFDPDNTTVSPAGSVGDAMFTLSGPLALVSVTRKCTMLPDPYELWSSASAPAVLPSPPMITSA